MTTDRKTFLALVAAVLLAPALQAFTCTYRVALRDEYGLQLGHDTSAKWQVQVYDETRGCYTHNPSAMYDVKPTSDGYNLLFTVSNGIGYDRIEEGDALTLYVFRTTDRGTEQVDTIAGALPKLGSYAGEAILPVSFTENAVKDMSDINTAISYAIWEAGLADCFDNRWTNDVADADHDGVSNIDECRAGTDPYGKIREKGAMTTFAEIDANYPMMARTDTLDLTVDAEDWMVLSASFNWSSGHAYSIRRKYAPDEIGEDLPLCTADGKALGTRCFTTPVSGGAYPTGVTTIYAIRPVTTSADYYIGLAVDGNVVSWFKVYDEPLIPAVEYRDADGKARTVTNVLVVSPYMGLKLTNGWYAIRGRSEVGSLTVEGEAHLILLDGAKLTVRGGKNQAGIAVEKGNALTIYGQANGTGELIAYGGPSDPMVGTGLGGGSGIGGGYRTDGGTVTINGGVITAEGGGLAPGIGGGFASQCGTVTINGGLVKASSLNGSGIGTGYSCTPGGQVTVNGGTVVATGACATAGSATASDIGCKGMGIDVVIRGGSVKAARIDNAPRDGTERVFCVTAKVEGLKVEKLKVEGLEGYGTNDIYSVDGSVYLWLPNRAYDFSLSDGTRTYWYHAVVKDKGITVEPLPSGFTVNGLDLIMGPGEGWTYDDKGVLTLNGAMTYVLSGMATNNEVQVNVAQAGATVVLSNAVIYTVGRPALYVDQSFSLLMAGGTSYLAATNRSSAVMVEQDARMTVGLASGADRRDAMVGVFNYGVDEAIVEKHLDLDRRWGSVFVSGGTFFVWADKQAVAYAIDFGYDKGAEVLMTGASPETLLYKYAYQMEACALVGPGVTVTVKNVPHVAEFTVSNSVGQIWWSPIVAGTEYRAMEGDDVFIGYTMEAGYVSQVGNPLVYPAIEDDITVDASTIPILPLLLYRAWNEETRQMEDRVCAKYEVVTSATQTLSNGWYVVRDRVATTNLAVVGEAHLILCDGAKLTAQGGGVHAGVGVAKGNALTIYGQANGTGELVAQGGWHSAGIGGGEGTACGSVTINGGVVTANGNQWGAGIGGGSSWRAGGTVTINGGRVSATGLTGGAGIGGGSHGSGGTLTVNGGTVTAKHFGYATDIGGGGGQGGIGAGATVTINGGSVKAAEIQNSPSNGVGRVYCVTAKVEELKVERLKVGGLAGYGTNDIYAIEGKVYLWLPNGTHGFTLSDGERTLRYCAVVNGQDVTVEPLGPVGFYVNGVDISRERGEGWDYNPEFGYLLLGTDGTYVFTGAATNSEVQIRTLRSGATVVLSNAVVFASGRPAIEVHQDTTLLMAGGASYLAATNGSAAVTISEEATLTVDLAPGGSRKESMIGVFNYGEAPAIAKLDSPWVTEQGPVKVNGGTFFVWADSQVEEAPDKFTCGAGEVMMTGKMPEELRYATACGDAPCVLVGPGVTVTVKDGIPHASGFTVSIAVQAIEESATPGVYRVMEGDDVFVGYAMDADCFTRAANPLVYAAVESDVTVDADVLQVLPYLAYRAWNEATRQMEEGLCTNYTAVTANTQTLSNGWYAVIGAVATSNLTVSGAAHLILKDGAKLTATGGDGHAGIAVAKGNALTIYGQPLGTGELIAQGGAGTAGIGGNESIPCGTVTINGGKVAATGGDGAAGIGGGYSGNGGTVTINGGKVEATGDYQDILPEGYTAVEYIESTSNGNQYINTEYVPKADTKVVCRILDKGMDASKAYGSIFGSRRSWFREYSMYFWLRRNNLTLACYGRAGAEETNNATCLFPFGDVTTVTCLKKKCSWVNDAGTQKGSIELSGGYDVKYEEGFAPLVIFALNSSGAEGGCDPTDFWGFRLYSFQIYEDAELKRDFVPCVTASGEAGLYDTAKGKFYPNAGKGQPFNVGAESIFGGAGIGGGHGGSGGTVTINGGTVTASSIGGGADGSSDGTLTIDGGSVNALTTDGLAKNSATKSVWCVTVEVEKSNVERLKVEGLAGYGVNDIYPMDGKAYLWLPNGTHVFTVDGVKYCAVVEDAPTTAVVPEEGSEYNPWKVGEPGHEGEVTAWTNGTGALVIEGTGAVGSMPWAENPAGIAELVRAKGVTGKLETLVGSLPDLTMVNGLTREEFSSAALGFVRTDGFSAIEVDPATQEAKLSVVISKAETLDKPEWKPVATNDVPVKADTPAGFFIVAPAAPSDLDLPPIVTVK